MTAGRPLRQARTRRRKREEGCNKGRAEAEPDDEGLVMSQAISESGRLYLTSMPLSSSGIRRARRDRSVARENSDSAPGAKLPT